jgi:NAD(P)-dependent dehydrogenase (short-subunit alcohol dehydrogenase family)
MTDPKALYPGVALVTGAANGKSNCKDSMALSDNERVGIGQAIAYAFAREGCMRIVIADLSQPSLQETHNHIKATFKTVDVFSCVVDVAKPDDVTRLLDQTVAKFGRVDYAVNAAGIMGVPQRSHEMSVEEFDRINHVDYRGCWLCSREELKHMVQQEPLPTHDGRPGNRG